MDSVSKMIGFGITLALAFDGVGRLPEATRWMAELAASAQPQMISLGRLNRSLQAAPGRRHPVTTQHRPGK